MMEKNEEGLPNETVLCNDLEVIKSETLRTSRGRVSEAQKKAHAKGLRLQVYCRLNGGL